MRTSRDKTIKKKLNLAWISVFLLSYSQVSWRELQLPTLLPRWVGRYKIQECSEIWTLPGKNRQISREACTFLFIHLYQLFLLFDPIIHLLPFSSHSSPCSSSSSFTSLKQLDIGFWNISVLYWFLPPLQSRSDGLSSVLFMRFCHRTFSISSVFSCWFTSSFTLWVQSTVNLAEVGSAKVLVCVRSFAYKTTEISVWCNHTRLH